MLRSTSDHSMDREEAAHDDGVILVLLALMTTVLALLVGFALDTGNLYSARLAAQTAADAASLSGATAIAGRDASATTLSAAIATGQTLATQIATANLSTKTAFNTTSSNFVVTPSATTYADRVEFNVQISSPVNLYLLSRIPGYEQSGEVRVTSTSRIVNANFGLILDTSRSMRCPKTESGTTCPCMDLGTCGTDGLPTKLDALKAAAKDFVSMFDESRDRGSLVAFGHTAEVLVPIRSSSSFVKADFNSTIDGLTSAGATNISDGLLRSYLEMKRVGVEDQAAYIAFTDGAPSSVRILAADPKASAIRAPIYDNTTPFLQAHNILGHSFSNYDVISYAALWGKAGDPDFKVSSPHSLAFTPSDNGVFTAPENSPSGPITCNWGTRPLNMDGAELPPQCFMLWSIPSPGNASETFKQLFNSPAFYDPDGNVMHVGDYWSHPSANVWNYNWPGFDGEQDANGLPLTNPKRGVYRKLYFDVALAYADFMRNKGGTIFTVGLGMPAAFVLDPYQNPDFDHDLKSTFLKRMAVDSCGVADPMDPPFSRFPTYDELFLKNVKTGMFVSTTDADELKQLFRVIGKKLKLALIK